MDELFDNFFNWQILMATYPLLLKGLWMIDTLMLL